MLFPIGPNAARAESVTLLSWIRRGLLPILVIACGSPFVHGGERVLERGDIVNVTVYDYPELRTETRVGESGTIVFPLIGEIKVAGATPADTEKAIAKGLSDGGFIRKPQVRITLVETTSQQVSVVGEVKTPGKYPLGQARRISDVIAAAGGLNPETGGDKAILIRKSDPAKKVEVDLYALFRGDPAQNATVEAEDIVYVPRAAQFYIYGEVRQPGRYRLERNMTVQQAISVGGGLTPQGTERGMEVTRKNANGEQETIEAEGKDMLKPDDVVFIKESLF